MKISSFRLISSVIVFVATLGGAAFAGTIQFTGTISAIEQPSTLFNVGDSVVLSYTLSQPLVNQFSGPLSSAIFVYDSTANFLSVGSTNYSFNQPAQFVTEYNYFGQYGPNFQGGLDTSGTVAVGLGLYSTTNIVTTADGILLDGLPLSSFDNAYGRLFDVGGGISFWNITGYSSTGFEPASVPESTSTAVALGLGLLALAAFTRLRRCYGRT